MKKDLTSIILILFLFSSMVSASEKNKNRWEYYPYESLGGALGCYAGASTLLAWKLLGYPGGLNAWPYLFLATYIITSYTCTIGVDIAGSSFGIDGSKNLAFIGALIGIPVGFSYTEFIFGEDAKRWWWLIVPLVTGHFSALGYNLRVKLKSPEQSISINFLPERISLTFRW